MRILFSAALAAALLFGNAPAEAQLGGLGGLANRIGIRNPLGGNQPITTNIADARWGQPELDNFTPRDRVRSMMELQRTPNGGFVLQPGYYEMHTQSYCLHAGTHGPGGGDGISTRRSRDRPRTRS